MFTTKFKEKNYLQFYSMLYCFSQSFPNQIKSFNILAIFRRSVQRVGGARFSSSESLHAGNAASFEELSQLGQAVGSNVSDLTRPRFELQTFRTRSKRVTARPSSR